jgi:hypothetical protein
MLMGQTKVQILRSGQRSGLQVGQKVKYAGQFGRSSQQVRSAGLCSKTGQKSRIGPQDRSADNVSRSGQQPDWQVISAVRFTS